MTKATDLRSPVEINPTKSDAGYNVYKTKQSTMGDEDSPLLEEATVNSEYVTNNETNRIYRRRWYILLLFSFLSANQSNLWITYGAVLDTAKDMYNVSDGKINLLAAMGPAGFIPLSFFSSWVIGEYGLRVASIGACFMCAAGSIVRCFADESTFWIVLLAQVLNAAAGPVVMTGPPALSAAWFGVNERTFATAISSLANYGGSAVGFLVGLAVTNVQQLTYLLYLEAIFSCFLLVLFVVYFPSRPPTPPSATAAVVRENMSLCKSWGELMRESAAVFKSKDGFIILMISGISSGVNGAWGAMLVYILAPYYSQWDIQWLGLFNIFSGVLGGVVLGKIHDHYHHYKFLMWSFFLASACLFGVMSLATQRIIVCDFMEIMALNIAIGFAICAIYPVSLEALVEVTYPVKEEVSTGLISLVNNFACLALFIVGTFYPGNYLNWGMTGVCTCCFLLMLVTKEVYRRSKIDIGK